MFYKDNFNRMFCYSLNTACDRNGFVLGTHVSSGNVHDSVNFDPLFTDVIKRFPQVQSMVADAGYVTPHIAKTCFDHNILPVLPYKRPMTKKDYFRKYEYVYDEYFDQYICPNQEVLVFRTINREGRRIYKSDPNKCVNCPDLSRCTQSANHQKEISRHVWEYYREEANHLRHTTHHRELYSKRKETIERVFADLKEKHGLRYTHYRGIGKVRNEAMLAFACMNLKKLATWGWNNVA